MIIFSLEALSDDSHRRHFIEDPIDSCEACWSALKVGGLEETWQCPRCKQYPAKWKLDWQEYYDACDKDEPVRAVLNNFIHLTQGEPFNHDVQIWSTNCESVREKTLKWLVDLTGYCEDFGYWNRRLKMRPIGDNSPTHELKERWLKESQDKIDFVFESDPESIRMFRSKGIFVFDCNQGNN